MAELVPNGKFETDLASWVIYTAAYVTATRDTTEHHSGVASMKLVGQYANTGAYTSALPVVVGQSYRASMWVKGTGALRWGFFAGGAYKSPTPAIALTGDWQPVTMDWVATATNVNLFPMFTGTPTTVYIDDVSVDLTPTTPPPVTGGGGGSVMRGGVRKSATTSVVRGGARKAATLSIVRGGTRKTLP